MRHDQGDRRQNVLARAIVLTLLFCAVSLAADTSPQVSLDTNNATPRRVEVLTQRSIVRDYTLAWSSLSQALESNTTGPLNGLFEGTASAWLRDTVRSQQRSGITSHYSNQNHKLEAIFYAQEGDVIELRDMAEYDVQISDGTKVIHTEHALVRFVVLMTPGADRWVIRQIQALRQF